ncbi:MAG: helix-turn-helix transcriptional regulator [Clostridia bacterium]|nr:helix-turn-helix transcriptional regulator [Clostridia bacterium]
MTHIGIKIKELRKKKDLTQEKLAEYLNVSFQAISKWETGAASPDLSMIVPLVRLLGVLPTSCLALRNRRRPCDKRSSRSSGSKKWHTGDTAKRYEIARAAVAEYPGNFEYLLWLAGKRRQRIGVSIPCERHGTHPFMTSCSGEALWTFTCLPLSAQPAWLR